MNTKKLISIAISIVLLIGCDSDKESNHNSFCDKLEGDWETMEYTMQDNEGLHLISDFSNTFWDIGNIQRPTLTLHSGAYALSFYNIQNKEVIILQKGIYVATEGQGQQKSTLTFEAEGSEQSSTTWDIISSPNKKMLLYNYLNDSIQFYWSLTKK